MSPLYCFRCSCGSTAGSFGSFASGSVIPECSVCCKPMVRDWRVERSRIKASFRAHFNHSVGEVVRTPGEFRSALQRKSEEAEAATGIPHRYVAFDGDPEDVGVNRDRAAELLARRKEKHGW